MIIRRDVASIPVRSAKETWRALIELISVPGSTARVELEAAASVMESIIADECPASVPIVVKGYGPRLRVYLSYGANALDIGLTIDPLTWNPTDGDWRTTAPCFSRDVTWMSNALAKRAPRVTVHDIDDVPDEIGDAAEEGRAAASNLTIAWDKVGQS